MSHNGLAELPKGRTSSRLTLADRLIDVAAELDRSGFRDDAKDLIELANKIFDQWPTGGLLSAGEWQR
jgi:hypothetical protein